MDLAAGTRLGPYEVVCAIGAGGMGEVYRARDTRLNRTAAIKILSRQFSSDPDRLARFEREARTLASLNHPNIAQIYGTEREGDLHALAMEFVDGEDLAAMLARGPLPMDDAVSIARQIADALEAAHEHGIVHRDLKPANVKVRADGTVKVLDFGLAKSMGASDVISASQPTLTSPVMTQVGVILGTAAYMSPEQAKGKAVDRATDLWAFGAVLYEMLVGRPAFAGETVTDVLAAIVTREPEWTAIPVSAPAGIHRLLRRCLERDRRRRLADAGEARFQLEESVVVPGPVMWSWSGGSVLPWAIAALLAVAVAVLALRGVRQPAPETSRFSLELPPTVRLPFASRPAVAVSADGKTIVFVGSIDGVERLFARRIDSFEATEIPGTQTASLPAISPDGRTVAFSSSTKLAKVSIDGGPVTILADTVEARGVSWDEDGSILFVPRAVGTIWRVPAAGGQPTEISKLASAQERTHRWPQQLPGGALIFTTDSDATPDAYDDASIVAQMPDGSRHVVLTDTAMARYVPEGRLIFARGGTLFAVGFDPQRAEISGTPVEIAQQVAGDATTGAHHFAVSGSGTLVYISGRNAPGSTSPAWVSKGGAFEVLSLQSGAYSGLRISPDGQQMASTLAIGAGSDIWVHNFQRRTSSKLTFGGENVTPMWSRSGATLYYTQLDTAGGMSTIMRRPADGSRQAEAVTTLLGRVYLNDVTPDDRALIVNVYGTENPNGPGRSWIGTLALEKGATPVPLPGETDAYNARLSHDGRWLAYVGMYPNREVYVRSMTGGGRWQVTTNGGEEPKWSRDGRRLLYRNDNELYAVTLDPRAAAFEATAPALVLKNIYNLRSEHGISYDVAADDRFLMLRPAEEAVDALSLRVITNWSTAVP